MDRTHIKCLVCGGRDFRDTEVFNMVMSDLRNRYAWPLHIIVGYDPDKKYPPGADEMAWNMAVGWGMKRTPYPYHYHLGKAGGGSRNKQMLEEGQPELVVAFPTKNSKGTWDMVRRARKANITTIVIEAE